MQVAFQTAEGHTCGLVAQIADVETVLISTADLTKAGNRVTLSETEGIIENQRTGKTIKLEKRGGMYILKMWVPDNPPSVFARPGRKP